MTTHDTRKPSLDAILDGIRAEEPTRDEIDTAVARARAALGFEAAASPASTLHIERCAGFQALIPDHVAGRLPRTTALLLEDHSRECIPCRRALIAARTPSAPVAAPVVAGGPAYAKWASAAAAVAGVLLAGYAAWQLAPGLSAPPRLTVLRVDGTLSQVRDGALFPLRPGMSVPATDLVRTARASGALLQLDDGSRVEMRDRTEFSVRRRHGNATVALGNGSIIVEASPQGAGHLDVRTDDCLVSVKGTIFSVNRGTKGSRVSVVEGAVRVDTGGSQRLLKSGDQVATTSAVAPVAVADEIAWSKDAVRYDRLLAELNALRQDLSARVPNPTLRTASTLLDHVPAGTVVYAAIPNLTEALVEARKVFLEHVAQSPELSAWWSQHMSGPDQQKEMDDAFERVRAIGSQLGDEIVVALVRDAQGHVDAPIVMAEVKDPDAVREALAAASGSGSPDAKVTFDGAIATIAPNLRRSAGAPAGRLTGGFHDRLAQAYQGGVSWVFGADLKSILAEEVKASPGGDDGRARKAATLERMGLLDTQYVIATRVDDAGAATNRAEISFDHPRRGLADWLAAPAPLGALDFVSPDAAFAAAAVVKRPELLLADALSWASPECARMDGPMSDGDSQKLFGDLRDLAGALGGDVAVALDGPVLPAPSWKLAVEVYDPSRAQAAIERIVAFVSDRMAEGGGGGRLALASEDAGNRTDWVLRFTGSSDGEVPAMRYTYSDGYLIAAPDRVLVDRALEQRAGGYRLAASKAFTDLLPTDGHVDVSAVVWQHLGPTFQPLLSGVTSTIDVNGRKQLEALLGDAHPSLLTVYAEDDRIVVGSRDKAGVGSLLGSMLSASTLGDLGRLLARGHHPVGEGAAATR